ncbi:MAG: DNA polymerase Y family protein [Acidobacteria bacterium]|nr:DNA polymerase Y family protein [Acidobacteriota bacterium]
MDRMACVEVRGAGARADNLDAVAGRLSQFSPDVEPSRDAPGVFWVNASGLSHLYRSPRHWAERIAAALRADGHRETTVAVGFTRFGTYAVARRLASTERRIAVIRDRAGERALAGKAPLDRLGLDRALIDSLEKLGVRTVSAFLELPAEGVRRRFGPDAHLLHRRASGDLNPPLQPIRSPEPLLARHDFDQPESDVTRLLFAAKRLVDRLLAAAVERREMLVELTLHLRLDGSFTGTELLAGGVRTEVVRPAAPTLDIAQLMTLVRLRFESIALERGVVDLRVAGRSVRTAAVQEGLFVERPPRDLSAANRALARVRARFGDAAVARARLAEGHLPEARFAWEPVHTIPLPASVMVRRGSAGARDDTAPPVSAAVAVGRDVPMVRRVYANPHPLPAGHVAERAGPYRIAGGWWRMPVSRDYYFARMRNDDLLWIYYDRARRRWCCQGRVE